MSASTFLTAYVRSPAEDDRELQMAVCYFLAQNAPRGDERVIRALVRKLTDPRAVGQSVYDSARGMVGSDFYVDACAADALTVLSSVDLAAVHTNHYESYLSSEAWSPRRLHEVNGSLVLTGENVFGDDSSAPSWFLREDRDVCVYCNRDLSWNYTPKCPSCGKALEVKTVRIPPRSAVA